MKSAVVKFIVVFVLCGAAAGLGGAIVQRFQAQRMPPGHTAGPRPAPVEVAPIEYGPIQLRRTFSGTLEALAEFFVAPKIAGRILRLDVDLADTVQRGQVVAWLDNDEHVQSVAQAAAELAVAKANVSEAQSALHTVTRERRRVDFVQLQDAEKRSLDEILDLTLRTATGEQVALRNVVTVEPSRGPSVIERKDQQRLVTVTANVAGRDMGSVALDVQAVLAALTRPVGYDLTLAGNYEEQQKASRELLVSLVLALVLVYMVLACQYESLRDPLVVMMSVPLAAVGVLVVLFLTRTTFNIQSYIGCIMLGGIVVNNAILLVDQAGQLRMSGSSTRDAVAEAGRRRLRPILMTTLTTVFALLPLAFGIGEGADAQAPLARAVVGGLTASTLITLVLIPVVYSLFHPESHRQPSPGAPVSSTLQSTPDRR